MTHTLDVPRLRARQRIVAGLRSWLYAEDFLELPGPVLVRGTCPDPSLDSFEVVAERPGFYLTTSCEYHIKRAVGSGAPRAFTLGPNFRKGEVGWLHNPEFTMLEWARAGAGLAEIESDLEAMVRSVHPQGRLHHAGQTIDLTAPWDHVRVSDALGVAEPFALSALQQAAQALDVPPSWQDDRTALFSLLLDTAQRRLGWTRPLWLTHWPAWLTSSAAADGELAARSELFIAGVEVADGFPFLTDPATQRANLARQHAVRCEVDMPAVQDDQAYLAALDAGLPAGAGMAMGVDRLVMLLTGAHHIRQVLAFAWDDL